MLELGTGVGLQCRIVASTSQEHGLLDPSRELIRLASGSACLVLCNRNRFIAGIKPYLLDKNHEPPDPLTLSIDLCALSNNPADNHSQLPRSSPSQVHPMSGRFVRASKYRELLWQAPINAYD